jgi:hypothetical protein
VLDAVEVWPSERVGVKTGPMMNELRDKAQCIAFGLRMLTRENPLQTARYYLQLVGLTEYVNFRFLS